MDTGQDHQRREHTLLRGFLSYVYSANDSSSSLAIVLLAVGQAVTAPGKVASLIKGFTS